MNILVLNSGSTTLKFKLFNEQLNELINGGIFLESDTVRFNYTTDEKSFEKTLSRHEFNNGAKYIRDLLNNMQIDAIGFRIVHGGEEYKGITKLDDDVLKRLENLTEIAPLHNPPTLRSIRSFKKYFPHSLLFGVFDTSFHNTIPEKAFIYGLPYSFYEDYKIRRYGFHGTSVEYVISELNHLEEQRQKTVVCHLGGGASITAVKNGASIDTSMGFTPLEGLIMATRAGDIDDGILHFLVSKKGYTLKHLEEIENTKSGLLGVSGVTSDMKRLIVLKKEDDKRATLAIDIYIYRIQKYVGSYAASMNGIDSLVFTGGVGSGSDFIRSEICKSLEFLNLTIDPSINNGAFNIKHNLKISNKVSNPIWVIPTNEELQIARKVSREIQS